MTAALTLEARLRGVLLGGAIRTPIPALGLDLRRDGLTGAFGPNGLERYAWAQDYLGSVSDYSPLILFTLEGLIRVQLRRRQGRFWSSARILDHAVRHWWTTLTYDRDLADLNGFLWDQDAFWPEPTKGKGFPHAIAKSPGNLALGPSRACILTWVAPVALLSPQPTLLAREMAHFVDGRPNVVAAAGWYAALICRVAAGAPVIEAAHTALVVVRGLSPELDAALTNAIVLAGENARPSRLGAGYEAEEAAALALWCLLTAAEPHGALRRARAVIGDNDTVARLVGQVLGAAHGDAWIEHEEQRCASLYEVISILASDAVRAFTDERAEQDDGLLRRYPTY